MLSLKQPKTTVLNERHKGKPGNATSAVSVAKDLQKLMLRMKGEFMMEDGRGVRYADLKKSDLFSQYEKQASDLAHIDLKPLTEEEKMSFFINVYNALTIHGLVECDTLPESVLDIQAFWRKTAYCIGGHIFSLDEIEHGILRCNKPHPAATTKPFKEDDPRLHFVLKKFDPRIHFALVCGAKSCPAINVYTAVNLNSALEASARSFCQQEVKVYEMRKEIHVSQLFQWYCGDFGQNDIEAVRWTIKFLDDDTKRILKHLLYTMEEHGMVDITYREYDWKLNKL